MSTPQSRVQAQVCPVVHGSPIDSDDPGVPLHLPEFAADPHRAYHEMRRRYGSLAPVELSPGVPATLVIGYNTAVRILNDPEHFPADPRSWQKNIPADCPILPLLEWRPMASRSTGADFARYRQAITASINEVDLYALHGIVEQIAVPLINNFCQDGSADLIVQYVFPLVFEVVNSLLGCTPEIGQQVAAGTAALLEGVDAEKGNQLLGEALMKLVTLKRAEPRSDITSVLLQHPSELDDVEASHHVSQVYGTGIEFQLNLIVNTLLLILTDERFGDSVMGGNLSTRDALDDVLFNDPPLANLLITYPRQPILIDGVWLPAHQPVVISMAACNNDPAIRAEEQTGNRSHLAWGLGPHACPAQSLSYLIAQDAIDQLLDALPEMRLDLPNGAPTWRPGPFHRALTALPVVFPPSFPMNASGESATGTDLAS
ncbi:cytochrome P450 [Nocardia sp. NPDC049220]|uniref:cytochrome P450 n=1 Tax=Nocardia sp. NPDC049220 TaxID=3155273 RepID=UPI0033FA424A